MCFTVSILYKCVQDKILHLENEMKWMLSKENCILHTTVLNNFNKMLKMSFEQKLVLSKPESQFLQKCLISKL